MLTAMPCLLLTASIGQTPAGDNLIGIWKYEAALDPTPRGPLTVTRRGQTWTAKIGALTSVGAAAEGRLLFSFSRNRGKFRCKPSKDGRTIAGYWLRPGMTSDPRYPGGSTQPFATPLILKREGKDSWRGVVRPLDNRFTLYLKVYREPDGLRRVLGAFRNPEVNSTGPAMLYRMYQDGDIVRFRAGQDPEVGIDARLVSPDRLDVAWEEPKRRISLRRSTPEACVSFFPRPPGSPRYVYRKPPETGDGWATVRAREVGLDEAAITGLIQTLCDADPARQRASLMHSFLVARHGKLVLEEYFFGTGRDVVHDIRSAGKTYSSVMLGAAMQKGINISPQTKLYDLLKGMGPFANPDPRKAQITLAHLMTHSAGLAIDDYVDASPGTEDKLQAQRANWWKFTLDLPMAYAPGTHYAYGSANINLMSAALTTATKTWLPEWFDRTVATPLQFGEWHWNLGANDEGYLGGGAWLRPRDLLKIGQTYLDGGVWRGKRIVSAAWVKESTAPHMRISKETTGLTEEEFGERYWEADDGYAWHLGSMKVGDKSYKTYAATGNGGQVVIVFPELDMTVAFTGGNHRQGGIWGGWGDQTMGAVIIPTMRK